MKRLIFTCLILISCTIVSGQAYLGLTYQKNTSLLAGPDKNEKIISNLARGTQLFVYSKDTGDDYYKVIVIETNLEGYVLKDYVKIIQEVGKNEEGIFTPVEKSDNDNSLIEIFNNTEKTLTLKLNETRYTFNPHEKRKIEILPGVYNYYASAPMVMPNYGTEKLESNYIYTWEFYIVTGY